MRGPSSSSCFSYIIFVTLKTDMDERFTYLISLQAALLMFHIFICDLT